MPTAKKRLNITLNDDTYKALSRLSRRRKRSVSHVGVALIEQALEYSEDQFFSRLSDERVARDEKRIPHEKVWK